MYIAAADFYSGSKQVWTEGLTLDEGDGSSAYLDAAITLMQERIERDLGDVFEAPNLDNDITLTLDVRDPSRRLWLPRRIRSITSVQTRSVTGTLTTESATLYRQHSDVGPAMDYLQVIDGLSLSTGYWPTGLQTVVLTGKFGYATPPTDIKRLCALLVYDFLRPKDDPFSSIETRTTSDGTITYGDGEAHEIMERYERFEVLAA